MKRMTDQLQRVEGEGGEEYGRGYGKFYSG